MVQDRQAECQVRYGGDGMRRDGRGLDGWSDDRLGPWRMMRRIRNREGPKRPGPGAPHENRHRAGGKNPRTERSGLHNDPWANHRGYQ